jgi:hypothetical protein
MERTNRESRTADSGEPVQLKPWSTPKVLVSELRGTETGDGLYADSLNPATVS